MPSNLVWSWPLHCNSKIPYTFMGKDGLNRKRGHAIIGFNHGLPCYVKNMALGPQSRQKPWPTASVFVYLSPSDHVFNIAWQAMIKTYTIIGGHLTRDWLPILVAMHKWLPKLVAKFWLPNLSLYQTVYWACDYLCMLGFKLNHVSNWAPRAPCY